MDNKSELSDIILGKPQKRGIWKYLTEKVEVTRLHLWALRFNNILLIVLSVLLLID